MEDNDYIKGLKIQVHDERQSIRTEPYLKLAKSVDKLLTNFYHNVKIDKNESTDYKILKEGLKTSLDTIFKNKINYFHPSFFQELKINLDSCELASNRAEIANQLIKTRHFLLKSIYLSAQATDCWNFSKGFYTEIYNDSVNKDSIIVIIRRESSYLYDMKDFEMYFSLIEFSPKKNHDFPLRNFDPIFYSIKIKKSQMENINMILYQNRNFWGSKMDTIYYQLDYRKFVSGNN